MEASENRQFDGGDGDQDLCRLSLGNRDVAGGAVSAPGLAVMYDPSLDEPP